MPVFQGAVETRGDEEISAAREGGFRRPGNGSAPERARVAMYRSRGGDMLSVAPLPTPDRAVAAGGDERVPIVVEHHRLDRLRMPRKLVDERPIAQIPDGDVSI